MPIATESELSFNLAKVPMHSKMPEIIQGPILSHYMDFRKYLLDFYEYKRALTKNDIRPYNFGVFSAAADIKSPNYLKMIIDGKRNLSDEMIGKFAKALGFNKELTSEFRTLVNFCQATDPAERNYFLKELTSLRVEIQLKNGEIDQRAWEKVPNWVAWILYAMLDQRGVNFKIDELKDLLRGKASASEIQEAMDILVRSGEMVRDESSGGFKKGRNLIESPEDVPVALVRKLQSQLMYLGLESLYQDSASDREFGSLTLALNKDEFEHLKFQLRKMRKEINKDNSTRRLSGPGERVYQLNLQLFPVTESSK